MRFRTSVLAMLASGVAVCGGTTASAGAAPQSWLDQPVQLMLRFNKP